ncbi:MAG TPA: carboxypeptidase regulatory-like domain-containing protein [Bryobacteraceae bacterium]|nr:carboxypeptidase regulatory-like domain-containing protein [Bryobacteraceae bacterium]
MNVIHRRAAVREYLSGPMRSGYAAVNVGNSAPPSLCNGKITLRFLRMAAGLMAAMLLVSTGLYGQAVAVSEVSGAVTDPSGKLIPGANVTMTEDTTKTPHATQTDSDGHYVISNLPPGPYTLDVKSPGFKDYKQAGIVLEVAHNIGINVAMSVGSVNETIEVTANADMVETKDSAIAQVMDPVKITELPLNGRNLTQLLTLTGGGSSAPGGDLTGSKNIQGSNGSGTFSVAGGQANGVNYLLDGGDNNDSFSNVNLPIPFPDAVQEFSVQTNALQAQFGLHPGGAVNVVTKSGSNAFHGDLFEFLRNYELNARPKGLTTVAGSISQSARDSLKRSQFGGTGGGRIVKDKLFFFGGYQQTVQRSNPGQTTAHVPTALTESGDFSVEDAATSAGGCQTKAITLKDPLDPTGKTVFANNVIPQSRFDPAAVKLLSYIPVSTDHCGLDLYGQPANNPDWQIIGRIDYVKSARHQIYGRYYIYNFTAQAFFDGKNALTTGPNPGNLDETNSVTLGDTFTLSPTKVNSFHATFNRRADNRGSASNLFGPKTLGMNLNENMPDNYIQVTVGNYFNIACGTCAPGYFNVNNYQISDDYQMTKGKHQLAFGFDGRKEQFNSLNNQQSNGQFTFSGGSTTGYSGDNLADLLLGHMSTWNQGNALSDYMRMTVLAAYAQDTWRAAPGLTINLGARWEPYQPADDKQCRGNQFNLADFIAGVHSKVYPNAPAGLLFGADQSHGCRFTASDWLATSPRVGLVWDPTGKGKQTLRAAFGLMHDSLELFYPERWTTNPPYASAITFTNPSITAPFSNPWNGYVSPTGISGDPFPGAAIFPTNGTYVSIPPNVHAMYTMQWNFSYSRQIGANWLATLTYIGNRTVHIPGANEQNMPTPSPTATTANETARRPLNLINPQQGAYYTSIVQTDDGNWSSYHGLLLKAEHRLASHYTWLTNYTWSHCISTYDFGGELAGNNYEDPLNRNAEKGDCNYDRRHIFNTSLVIASPGVGNGFAKKFTKDWQVAPIISLDSGQPLTITTGSDVSLTGVGADRPNVNPTIQTMTGTLNQYFNPAAFVGGCTTTAYIGNPYCVPLGTFGDAGRDIIHGPGSIQFDMSATRRFAFKERYSFELRGDFFNIMNHANWGNPATGLTSSTFGQITSFGSPRLIQVSAKFFY